VAAARSAALALVAVLAACASEPEPLPPPPPPEPAVTRHEAPAAPAPVPRRELCPVLTALLAEENGFAALRGQALAEERWLAREVLPGTRSCTIEGDAWPRATFQCVSGSLGSDRTVVDDEFEHLAAEIDRCLARPSWFPRTWERGQEFTFALGERQLAWIDDGTRPPSTVILKVQQDLVRRDYELRVSVGAVR
jgi:hypothetical protein